MIKYMYLFVLLELYTVTSSAKVILTGELPPYSTLTMQSGGDLVGDIMFIFHDMGLKDVKLSYQPWSRGLKSIVQGNAIAAFPFTWSSEKSKFLYFSVPLTFDIQSWYTTPNKIFLERSSWDGYTACIPRGWFSDSLNETLSENTLKIRTTNRLSQCIQLLQKGKVDLIPINDRFIKTMLDSDKNGLHRLTRYRQNMTYYLVSPRNPAGLALVKKFDHYWVGSQFSRKWQ